MPTTQPPPGSVAAPDLSRQEIQEIRRAVRDKYAQVSASARGKFEYPTGRAGAEKLAYPPEIVHNVDQELMRSFCGVGNPFAIQKIEPGAAVLDIGCGGGFDLLVARFYAGDTGRVCGTDLTEEMIARASDNLAKAGITDVEIEHVDSDSLPYEDGIFDVVISNGVVNLSPCKQQLFAEIFRVLKPGGRLQFADIILDKALPSHMVGSLEAWSQ